MKLYSQDLKLALDFLFVKLIKSASIYTQYLLLHYHESKKVFKSEKNAQIFTEFDLENLSIGVPDKIIEINTIQDVRVLAKQYKYIACDEDLVSLFHDFRQIELKKYSYSKEGLRWQKIFNLFPIFEVENLKCLSVFQDLNEFEYDFTFEYEKLENIESLNGLSLTKLYLFFFKQVPEYTPQSYNDMKDLYFIEQKGKIATTLINHSLIRYLDDEVLYVGNQSVKCSLQIKYNPKFFGYPVFIDKQVEYSIISRIDENLALNQQYSKLYAKNLNLVSRDVGFYTALLKKIKEALANEVKFENLSWLYHLYLSSDYICLIEKIDSIFKFFDNLKQEFCINTLDKNYMYNGFYFDFYDPINEILIDISWKTYSAKIEGVNNLKLFNIDKKYFVISYEKILELKASDFFKDLEVSKVSIKEDDLFYWNTY